MNQEVYQYHLDTVIPIGAVKESLYLAVMATESVYGRSHVRLDAIFSMDNKKRLCSVDASTDVGRHIAKIFTGFLTSEFGEDKFSVKRIKLPNKKE
jgi:hypothetical protein